MTDNQIISQPLDALMTKLNLSNADLVKASTEQLTFKMVNKGRSGKRISPNVQEKILNALLKLKPELKIKCRDLFRYEAPEDLKLQIREVLAQSKQKKISYPQFIDALAALGVIGYKAQVAANEYTFYISGGECYIEQGIKVSDDSVGLYSKEALIATLKDVQSGKIDHPVFLKRIYEAGIVSYEVNIRHRYIRYMGLDHSYKEEIPESSATVQVAPPPTKTTPKVAEDKAATVSKKPKPKAKIIKNKKIGMTRKQRNTISKLRFRKRRPVSRSRSPFKRDDK